MQNGARHVIGWGLTISLVGVPSNLKLWFHRVNTLRRPGTTRTIGLPRGPVIGFRCPIEHCCGSMRWMAGEESFLMFAAPQWNIANSFMKINAFCEREFGL
jgi:hypothetical protein